MTDSKVYHERMRAAAQQWVEFSDRQWELFRPLFRTHAFASRDMVSVPGKEPHRVFFVAEGLIRFYYLEEEGEESDRLFAKEGTFVRAVTAALLDKPYGSQALEPSVVLSASYDSLSKLFEADPVFDRFARKLAESMLILKDRHVWSLQNLAAADRYRDFAERFPDLTVRVPQYHIAKYLGMSEVSLSRLKGHSSKKRTAS